MQAAVKNRSSIKGKITRFSTFLENAISNPVSSEILETRMEMLRETWKEYESIQSSIEALAEEGDMETQGTEREEQEDRYANIMAGLKSLIIKQVPIRNQSTSPPPLPLHQPSDHFIPKFEMQSFSGNYADWPNFKNVFETMVHEKKNLKDHQKLHILKLALQGDAARILSSTTVTDDNYADSWESVIRRYDHKRQLIIAQTSILLHLPSVKSESAKDLRKLLDTVQGCLRALKAMKIPTDNWDPLLISILLERLDTDTRRNFELQLKTTEMPTFNEIQEFIEQRCQALEIFESASKSKPTVKQVTFCDSKRAAFSGLVAPSPCVICKDVHNIHQCQQFMNASVTERLKLAKGKSLCFNCLRSSHSFKDCKSGMCRRCNRKHHTLLHIDDVKPKEVPAPHLQGNSTVSGFFSTDQSQVLLSTALIEVQDIYGTKQMCRALLDSGSQATFITEACCQRLGLKGKKTTVSVDGLGTAHAGVARKYVHLMLSSNSSEFTSEIDALVLSKVTGNLPNHNITSHWGHLQNLKLADPTYYMPGPIDILLGGDIYDDILLDGRISGQKGSPTARNSVFGWILSGRLQNPKGQANHVSVFTSNVSVEDQLKKFWELEESLNSTPTPMSLEEKACEVHFSSTHRRDQDERFIVRLPFRHETPPLGQSKEIARRTLLQQERRLSQDPRKKAQYVEFMREFIWLGHMKPLQPCEITKEQAQLYYLPHHAVMKEASTTTALRVVFNGSMKTSSGVSLNDRLLVGPKLQQDILPILLRFRTHAVAFTADIAKMYRQIAMHPEDCDYQRVLWRETPDRPIEEFKLVTVTYGTATAPYLATKCLQQLAVNEKSRFPEAAEVLLRDFYVDDVMSGHDSQVGALLLQHQLIHLLSSGCFQLRKWSSNDQKLLDSLPPELRETTVPLQLNNDDSSVKALGLHWHPTSDLLSYSVDVPPSRVCVTKRTLLSDTSRIYDPLGLGAPVIINMKLLFQQLWLLGLSWDEPLPFKITEAWNSLRQDLPVLEKLRIPRYVKCKGIISDIQLHGFCDASERAYAACVYVRCTTSDGNVTVKLLTAKTKVAPIKKVSLPRLELCGALLLARLMTIVRGSLSTVNISSVHGWSDSTVVLAWLSYSPSLLKTFVANRVSEIQDVISPQQWKHVPGVENPADCASRGISPSELLMHPLWWTGPEWLLNRTIQSKCMDLPKDDPLVIKEEKTVLNSFVALQVDFSLLYGYSVLPKLLRVTAYCRRFVANLKLNRQSRQCGLLTVKEINSALMYWIRMVQRKEFVPEVSSILEGDQLSPKSRLLSLNPFLDQDGILRVGGRLENSNLTYDRKFPILLPRKHHLTELIVAHEHKINLHAGAQLLLATLHRRFWILCGQDVVRRHIHKCVVCFRHRSQNLQQIMGQLPTFRTEPCRAFLRTGVDYAGPFQLRESVGRGRRGRKCWVSVFVCFVTHAIHLELVMDLTTDAFIAALRRFIARRGKCSDLFSDNGTNFVGAHKEVNEIKQLVKSSAHNQLVSNNLLKDGINWHFIPPASPQFGGLWEAGVKSMKFHMRRVIGNSILSFDEMQTVLCQIEACLNSRPLCPLSSDPSSLEVLTPGHFLIGDALTSAPDPDLSHLKLNQLSRWQLVKQLQQHFWKRWNEEFLIRLQQRPKWCQRKTNVLEGELFLIKDERLPPLKWKLGRVTEVQPGKDGIVRVVTLKTIDGLVKRPIAKLCPLPMEPTT